MNQQYAKNLQNLAQASKDYTDNKTSELYDILSEFEPYKVKESDVTITGTQSGFLVVTLSSALETVVLSGKRPLFVNGTIMNTLTQGVITTDTLFNVISFDKITQQNMKHVIGFETISTALGFIDTYTIAFMQDNNDQWYAFYNKGSIDTEEILSRIYDLDLQITDLNERVTTLENAGGSELYQHNICIWLWDSSNGYIDINTTIITSDSSGFTKSLLMEYLYSNNFRDVNTGLKASGMYNYLTSGTQYNVFGLTSTDRNTLSMICVASPMTTGAKPLQINVSTQTSLIDTVVQIL